MLQLPAYFYFNVSYASSWLLSNTLVDLNFNHQEIIITNPVYFDSIILNLITNALKYKSPDKPLTIEISLDNEAKFKVLSFKDNGVGIDVIKNKDKLFGMFNTFHGNKDARGMGLFITKTQIEAMKGKIEVTSELGKGATFRLYLLKG